MSESMGGVSRAKFAVGFVLFSAVFGPFMLARPPRFGGWNRRELLAIGIGMVAWWVVLELILGIPSAVIEVAAP